MFCQNYAIALVFQNIPLDTPRHLVIVYNQDTSLSFFKLSELSEFTQVIDGSRRCLFFKSAGYIMQDDLKEIFEIFNGFVQKVRLIIVFLDDIF